MLYSPRDLAGTQATGAGVDTTRCAVDNRLDALDVGLPSAIGASVRVRNLNTEGYTLSTYVAFCHTLHLLIHKIKLQTI